jgi:hypothetical protein
MTPKADFYTGMGLVIFSAVMFGIASRMPSPASFGLGPGGYPMLVTGVLAVLGIILAIQGWLQRRGAGRKDASVRKAADAAASPASAGNILNPKDLGGIAVLAASFWLYIVLMKYLGYLITTPVFLFFSLLQYGDRKWPRMILVSLITTAASWVLFVYAFRIFLPDFYFF